MSAASRQSTHPSSQQRSEHRNRSRPARRQQVQLLAAIEALETRAYLAVNPATFEFGTPTQSTFVPSSTMALVDVNRDGVPDLIDVVKATGAGTSKIDVQLGNGNGTFKAASSLISNGAGTTAGQTASLTVVDVNGDGAPDIILAVSGNAVAGKYYQGTVNVLLNNGNGTFAAVHSYSNVGYGTDAVAVGDFNGHPDIVVANAYDRSLRVLLGSGNGKFQLQPKLAVSGNFTSIGAADFNGDGNIDIVAASATGATGKIFILPGNGDGTFGLQTTINAANITKVAVGDIDGDGMQDIVCDSGGASFFKNQSTVGGPLSFAAAVTSANVTFGILAQPKANGAFEVISTNAATNTVNVAVANANGTFKQQYSFSTVSTGTNGAKAFSGGYGPVAVGAGDVNRDGRPDLVAVCASGTLGTVVVLTGDATGGYLAPQLQPVGLVSTSSYPNAVVTADVNGDGKMDVISTYYGASGAGGIEILLNNGHGMFGPATVILDANGPTGLAVADFNGDGKMDLAVSNRDNGTVSVFFGNGNGTFGAATNFNVGADPGAITVGIFNSHNDIVVANTGILPGTPGTTVSVLMGSGTGTFPTTVTLNAGNGPSSVVVGDFNKDNKPDIAVTNEIDGTISVFLASGSGTFAAGATIGAGFLYGPTALATADFDGDGNLDLVALDQTNDSLTQLKGNGDGTFSTQLVYNLNLPPTPAQSNAVGLAVAQINSDTNPDVVLTYEGTTASPRQIIGVMLNQNDGSGLLQSPVTFQVTGAETGGTPVTPVPVAVAAGDLNGDGKADLAILDAGGASGSGVSIVFNNSPVLPSITSAAKTTFSVGTAGTFTVKTSGSPTASLAEIGTLPSGVTFVDNGDGTGTLAGTPAVGTGGQYTIFFFADNGAGGTATQTFTLSVKEAPQITSAASTQFTAGFSGAFIVRTTGFPAATLSETGALPTGVSFTSNGNGTATLGGTPQNAQGTFTITITANNGVAPSATQVFTLTLEESPIITSTNTATFVTGQFNSFMITTTGFPTPGISETGRLPAGVSFFDNGNGTGTLSGSPLLNSKGTYSITLTAINGVSFALVQNFTLVVISPASPVFTGVKTASFIANQPGLVTIGTTGFPTATLAKIGALPAGVTFTDNTDGTATLFGTPAVGSGATYSLTFTANNGVGRTITEKFSLVVDEAPVITSINHATFTVGALGSFLVTATGVPAPALAPLTTFGKLPTGVTFLDHHNGTATISGRPAAKVGGTYEIFIVANNGISPTQGQLFTLTVNQSSAITSAAKTTFVTGNGGSFTITTTGFPDNILTETGALPTGLTFTDNGDDTATLFGTAGVGTGGTYHLTFGASNGIGAAASQVFTLTIDQPLVITNPSTATFTTGTVGTFNITSTGFPIGTISEVGALPAGLKFTGSHNGTATITGTPAAGTGKTYNLTLNAANSIGSLSQQLLVLTVNQAPTITSVNHATFSAVNGGTFLVKTTGFPIPTITKSGASPMGLLFTDNGDGTATLAGTIGAGVYVLTLTATNSVAVFNQVFTLVVS